MPLAWQTCSTRSALLATSCDSSRWRCQSRKRLPTACCLGSQQRRLATHTCAAQALHSVLLTADPCCQVVQPARQPAENCKRPNCALFMALHTKHRDHSIFNTSGQPCSERAERQRSQYSSVHSSRATLGAARSSLQLTASSKQAR